MRGAQSAARWGAVDRGEAETGWGSAGDVRGVVAAMTQAMQARELADALGAHLEGDGARLLRAVMPLDAAGPNHLSFFADVRYRAALAQSGAGALLVDAMGATLVVDRAQRTLLIVAQPALAAARAAALLSPPPAFAPGVHATAVVHETTTLAADASVGPQVVVEAHAQVGPGCVLEAQSFVGRGATLDKDVHLHPGARVLHGCRVGARSILHAGAVVGSDGFGYVRDEASKRRTKVPQLGNVVLGCDVELGSNTTVDRATFGSTTVGDGCKIDNLVMVAHNVQLGADCVLVAQTGIAGSTRLGERVVVGAQSGLVGHVRITDDVQLAARSGVSRHVSEPGAYGGMPLMPYRAWLRSMAAMRHLESMRRAWLGSERTSGARPTGD